MLKNRENTKEKQVQDLGDYYSDLGRNSGGSSTGVKWLFLNIFSIGLTALAEGLDIRMQRKLGRVILIFWFLSSGKTGLTEVRKVLRGGRVG